MTYLDNAATTRPCPACVEAVHAALTGNFANPSSLHQAGLAAKRGVEAARAAVASTIGAADPQEIYFTSGGTEANNLALFGAAYAGRRKGRRIVTTAIEHESVLEAAAQLEAEGFEVVRLRPDGEGRITAAQLEDAVNRDTILISVMMVNNEVGSILPVEAIRRMIKRSDAPALLHIDAVQAFGKLPVQVRKLGADLCTITAHKIHGPKGVGALYIKKGTILRPRTYGGEQEKKLRPGTEATPLIAGFGAAVETLPDWRQSERHVRELKEALLERLKNMDGVLVQSPLDGSPYVVSLSLPGYRSQTIIQALSAAGVYVSNGSACAKGKKSHVLSAMGLPAKQADGTIRVSFARDSTLEDVEELAGSLKAVMAQVAHT